MEKALDVARYIVNKSHDYKYTISNLKLQKLLYFCQAVFLVESKGIKKCFEENIEAWDFGPVVPVVYREFKRYGGLNIPKIIEYKDYSKGLWNLEIVKYNDTIIDKVTRDQIDNVIKHFGKFSASKLVDITHHQAPWIQAYKRRKNSVISIDSIYDYFKVGK